MQSEPLYCSFIQYTGSSPGWDVIMVLKSSRPSLLIKRAALGNLKASFHCTHWHRFFPLKKAPPFSPSLSSIVFTPSSVPPVLGDRNPQGREDVTALRCSEPLRYKVGGPIKGLAILCEMGPPGVGILNCLPMKVRW